MTAQFFPSGFQRLAKHPSEMQLENRHVKSFLPPHGSMHNVGSHSGMHIPRLTLNQMKDFPGPFFMDAENIGKFRPPPRGFIRISLQIRLKLEIPFHWQMFAGTIKSNVQDILVVIEERFTVEQLHQHGFLPLFSDSLQIQDQYSAIKIPPDIPNAQLLKKLPVGIQSSFPR
ncbi:hypothetical protein [uncultured Akkermansia sp.]|uniref:hypothetical protein n=1 Tax=uncultured Akkermansia sp. TaxID=512294 RepID=UPI0025EFB8F9|nr:hypothetical protein [uncultured Akkermansia sp.]